MTATYPTALKVFTTFHDFSDVIWAYSINEMHDEVVAIENILGANPFVNTPYTTFGGGIQDLYLNKAPTVHTHTHGTLLNDAIGDDHPMYMLVSGTRGFSGPVAGVAGSASADLVTLHQLGTFGYQNSAEVSSAVNAALGNLMSGAAGGPPVAGPATSRPAWRVQGGLHSGCTDGNGRVVVPFGTNYTTVQAFVCTKLPPQGTGPCPLYNWIEAQVTLVACNGNSATVQFSHDYSWQPNMWVSFSWLVIGV